jgi:pantetheine-phosphate adenylyltransferase
MFISASIVREIGTLGGDVSQFVQPLIAQRLREKIRSCPETSL